nr:MAG TPA: hypothetical protein [Bacteriophage sp.]
MRNFDRPWKARLDPSGNFLPYTILKYDYIGSSICGHNLALPSKVVNHNNGKDVIYKDLYGRLGNTNEYKLSTYRVYESDDENNNKEKLISGL